MAAFRASAQVWSVKHYLLLYTSAHGTTWDFIQPPQQRPGFIWLFPSSSSIFIQMVRLMRGNVEIHHSLLYLLWFLRFFRACWKPPERLLRAITEDGEAIPTFCSYLSVLHPQTIPAGLLSCAFWQPGWADGTQKLPDQKFMFPRWL